MIVSGCWGGRFDHLWSAINSAIWAMHRGTRVLAFADHEEILYLVAGGEKWEIEVGEDRYDILSLIRLGGDWREVTLERTKWSLDGKTVSP